MAMFVYLLHLMKLVPLPQVCDRKRALCRSKKTYILAKEPYIHGYVCIFATLDEARALATRVYSQKSPVF